MSALGSDSRVRASGRSLRRIWISSVAVLVAAIFFLGLLAASTHHFQRAVFEGTTSTHTKKASAVGELLVMKRQMTDPLVGVLYRLGGDEKAAVAKAEFDGLVVRFERALVVVEGLIENPAEEAHFGTALTVWDEVGVEIEKAWVNWNGETLADFLSQGEPPLMIPVWQRWTGIDNHLGDLQVEMSTTLETRADEVMSRLNVVGALVLGTVAVALLMAWMATRRLSRWVLRPLTEVSRAAQRLGESGAREPIAVPEGVAEVRELARVLSASAAALHESHGRLHTQAHVDSMTALPNRKAFLDRLGELVDGPGKVAVLFVDLDDFKHVNDSKGHAAGDELLRVLGLRLQAASRGCDIVARLGGDEFAVAMEVGEDPTAVVTVAERLRAALDAPVDLAAGRVRVGCSIGVAVTDDGTAPASAEELLGNADFAMYLAKNQGKNRAERYSVGLHAGVQARHELRNDLSMALERDQLVTYYQPVFALDSGELLGFEALVRWQHPERGLLLPESFLDLAEDSGAIIHIDAWVRDQACAMLAELRHHSPGQQMSVNLSPLDLASDGIVASIVATAERYANPPSNLVFEVTEGTAMTSTEGAAAALAELRQLGFHVALDDFGTGYSALRYLGELPADIVKVDRSFIHGPGSEQSCLLDSVVALVQHLGLHVVIEGIETPADLQRVSHYTGIAGQGFLFARPMPTTDALDYARHHAPIPSAAG
ncbi:MAG TPA: EAL domain-containing protein [Acidimicrobiales bacterium]|nr:EAL domain-containing protein [Acidimicrobiales bacterium]